MDEKHTKRMEKSTGMRMELAFPSFYSRMEHLNGTKITCCEFFSLGHLPAGSLLITLLSPFVGTAWP